MKTKRIIYFILIVVGALIMGFGDSFVTKEYALSLGIVFLMLGIYKSTQVWNESRTNEEDIDS
ncbi:hypothetical protein [Spongiimicrobium sp. 3-5]|uniref:hypothetical protein n=1 Tax=Spongiimicrobium sp. 3-5 TaxID=3332596 RepID=UPI00397EE4C9